MLLHKLLGQRLKEGDVGLELEIEGKNLPHGSTAEFNKYWHIVPDGSLRNGGLEYVLQQPVSVADVGKVLSYVDNEFTLSKTKAEYSFRTSTHVHVNMQPYNYNQVLSTILTSVALEPVLSNFCDEGRRANRFCLRVTDAEEIMNVLKKFFHYVPKQGKGFWNCLDQNRMKYSAMNLVTLKKYGSLEFRMLEGTQDWGKIQTWAEALVSIRDFAVKFETPDEVIAHLERNGPTEFARSAFGHTFKAFDYPNLDSDVAQAVSISYDLFLESRRISYKSDSPEAQEQPLMDYNWEGVERRATALSPDVFDNAVVEGLIREIGINPHNGVKYYYHRDNENSIYYLREPRRPVYRMVGDQIQVAELDF